MLLKKLFDKCIQFSIQFVVWLYLFSILIYYTLKYHLGYLCKSVVVIVFADCKVNILTHNISLHHANEHLNVLVNLFV